MNKKIVITNKPAENKKQQITKIEESDNGAVTMTGESFEEMFEQSLADAELNQGEIVSGKIASIHPDTVFVDVGFKSEGKIDREEFDENIHVGDDVQVMVVRMEDSYGNLVLSKRQADAVIGKQIIEKNFESGEPVEGRILKEIKGGFIVDITGVEAFLPASQLDLKRVQNTKEHIGKKYTFKIMKYEKGRNANIVLSRRNYLEEIQEEKRKSFFEQVNEGDVLHGTVKNILEYGAFVDLSGAIDGFLHLKDLSWGHLKNCNEVLKEGDEIEVKVLKLDEEQKKVNLGMKQLTEDPWDKFAASHKAHDVVKGEVLRLTDFGAFVKLEDGVEGLIHVTEMSWTKRVNHPKEVLKKGDVIDAMILDIENENRKLSLSLKQVLENPWENINERFPKGKKVKGTVKNVTNFGVFIDLGDDLIGLLHQNDVDWKEKNADLKNAEQFKKGAEIEVVVIKTNPGEKTISLGLKQLLDNPWEVFQANHPKGSSIKAKITKLTESGAIIALDNDLEGFLHASEMIKRKEQPVEEIYKEGDEITAAIKNIDVKREKIALSVREYERLQERNDIEQYITTKKDEENQGVTLGDLINLQNDDEDDEE